MANENYIQLLKNQGVVAWNEWRQENPDESPDLSGENLSGLELNGINLSEANLEKANFRNTKLESANFASANIKEANFYGIEARKANFTLVKAKKARFKEADLSDANLSDSDFKNATLTNACLTNTNLIGCELSGADLTGTDKFFYSWKVSIFGIPHFPKNYIETPLELIIGLTTHTRKLLSDAQYLKLLWQTNNWWKRFFLCFWGITCGYGQNLLRWMATSLFLILFFTLVILRLDLYISNHHVEYSQNGTETVRTVKAEVSRPTFERAIYFSVISFTTLGYGDITPVTGWGRFWLCLEVIVGYIMLGGLISIFSNKLARLS